MSVVNAPLTAIARHRLPDWQVRTFKRYEEGRGECLVFDLLCLSCLTLQSASRTFAEQRGLAGEVEVVEGLMGQLRLCCRCLKDLAAPNTQEPLPAGGRLKAAE